MTNLYPTAMQYKQAGLSFFPTDQKKPKYPLLPKRYDETEQRMKHSWLDYQERQPTDEEIKLWYQQKKATEIALVCGTSSNGHRQGAGLFIVDVDRPDLVEMLREECGSLWNEVVRERTRRGGCHLLMTCAGAAELRNTKLAMRVNPAYQSRKETPDESPYLCDIETRGSGGYACAAPTPNYVVEHGKIDQVPFVDMDDVVFPILEAAMRFNTVRDFEVHKESTTEYKKKEGMLSITGSIMQAFREQHPVSEMLGNYGYTHVIGRRFKRPGGSSTSLITSEDDTLAIAFSSHDPLRSPNAAGKYHHDAFSIYTLYEHGGDIYPALEAAARELGYVYHRPDYSESRDKPYQGGEILWYEGASTNDIVVVVDTAESAHVLNRQGIAVLVAPDMEVGNWALKINEFPYRYIWVDPARRDGATEMLALTVEAPLIDYAPNPVVLMHQHGGDSDSFMLDVVQGMESAQLPELELRLGRKK